MKRDKLTAGIILGGIALIAVGLIVVDSIAGDSNDKQNLVDLNETTDNIWGEVENNMNSPLNINEAGVDDTNDNVIQEDSFADASRFSENDLEAEDISQSVKDIPDSGDNAGKLFSSNDVVGGSGISAQNDDISEEAAVNSSTSGIAGIEGIPDTIQTADAGRATSEEPVNDTIQTGDSGQTTSEEPVTDTIQTADTGLITSEEQTTDTKQAADAGQTTGTDIADAVDSSVDLSEEDILAVEVANAVENLVFNEADGLTWPVNGEIMMKFSIDHAIYHKTLCQFKTNPAIVIDAEVGDEVTAAADGIITSIENNPITGTTMMLSIGNGYELVYGQLDADDWVPGEMVLEGEVLGTVAEPTKYFSEEGANVYFQVMKNGEPTNPEALLE